MSKKVLAVAKSLCKYAEIMMQKICISPFEISAS